MSFPTEATKVGGITPRFVPRYAMAAMPARYAFERGAWREATALQPDRQLLPLRRGDHLFRAQRGCGTCGDLLAARKDSDPMESMHKALLAAKNTYWATEVEIQRLAAAAWIALCEGEGEEALRFMRAGAELEDRNEKHIVTPARIVPARELLGEMLLDMKQGAAALQEFNIAARGRLTCCGGPGARAEAPRGAKGHLASCPAKSSRTWSAPLRRIAPGRDKKP